MESYKLPGFLSAFSATSTTGWASLVSRVDIFSERYCTVALSWMIPSLVALCRLSTSTLISLLIFLFPYPEWSRYKYAQLLPDLQSIQILLKIYGCLLMQNFFCSFNLQYPNLSWWPTEFFIFRNFWIKNKFSVMRSFSCWFVLLELEFLNLHV